jgi:hypothetical protein
MKQVHMVDSKAEDIHEATVALCETLGNLTMLDEYDSDDDACMHHAYRITVVNLDDDPHNDTIILLGLT